MLWREPFSPASEPALNDPVERYIALVRGKGIKRSFLPVWRNALEVLTPTRLLDR